MRIVRVMDHIADLGIGLAPIRGRLRQRRLPGLHRGRRQALLRRKCTDLLRGRIAYPRQRIALRLVMGTGQYQQDHVFIDLLIFRKTGRIPAHHPHRFLRMRLQIVEGGGQGNKPGIRAAGCDAHVGRGGLGPGVGKTWIPDGKSIDDFLAQGSASQERVKAHCGHRVFDVDTRQFIPAFFVFEVVGVIKIGGVGKIHTMKFCYYLPDVLNMKIAKSNFSFVRRCYPCN